jgi:hypothetical protein
MPMIARSRLNNENGGLDESSPYIKKKMGLMSQASRELTIFPGGIK